MNHFAIKEKIYIEALKIAYEKVKKLMVAQFSNTFLGFFIFFIVTSVNNLEQDFLKLLRMYNQNKKNYIKEGITEEDFIKEYLELSNLLSGISDETFKSDKNLYLNDFIKLSNTKIKKIFQEMREDGSDKIDPGIIFDYLAKTTNTIVFKNKAHKEHYLKSWKNKQKT